MEGGRWLELEGGGGHRCSHVPIVEVHEDGGHHVLNTIFSFAKFTVKYIVLCYSFCMVISTVNMIPILVRDDDNKINK